MIESCKWQNDFWQNNNNKKYLLTNPSNVSKSNQQPIYFAYSGMKTTFVELIPFSIILCQLLLCFIFVEIIRFAYIRFFLRQFDCVCICNERFYVVILWDIIKYYTQVLFTCFECKHKRTRRKNILTEKTTITTISWFSRILRTYFSLYNRQIDQNAKITNVIALYMSFVCTLTPFSTTNGQRKCPKQKQKLESKEIQRMKLHQVETMRMKLVPTKVWVYVDEHVHRWYVCGIKFLFALQFK